MTRIATSAALTPLTSGGTVTGEMDLAADVGPPTTTGDANVFSIQRHEKPIKADGTYPSLFEVGQTWQFKARFSGTAAAAANVLVTIWCYDRTTAKFYAIAAMQFVGTSLLTSTGVELGNAKDMSAVLGTSHIGVEVVGLVADQDLHLVMYESGR
jgi:hypothetical protein